MKLRISEVRTLEGKGARIVESIVDHLDAYLSACQLGITLASLGLGWVGEPFVARALEPVLHVFGIGSEKIHYVAFPVAFGTITFLHITLGEQVPKILAIQKYMATSLAVAIPLVVFYRIFKPFIWVLNSASNLMLRAVGIGPADHGAAHTTEDELRVLLAEAAQGGHVSAGERLLMENVLDLEDKVARSCMVPRNTIVTVNVRDSLDEQLRTISESGHTRLPLCEGNLDRTLGIVHVKDVFRAMADGSNLTELRRIMRPAVFVPENIRLNRLLREFQKRRAHAALLVDEYGVVAGMVTLENVLEELVGPIQDEFDSETAEIKKIGPKRYDVEGTCSIDHLRRSIGLKVPEARSDTIGGLVVEILGRIPESGETITAGRHTVTVSGVDTKRVRRVVIDKEAS